MFNSFSFPRRIHTIYKSGHIFGFGEFKSPWGRSGGRSGGGVRVGGGGNGEERGHGVAWGGQCLGACCVIRPPLRSRIYKDQCYAVLEKRDLEVHSGFPLDGDSIDRRVQLNVEASNHSSITISLLYFLEFPEQIQDTLTWLHLTSTSI